MALSSLANIIIFIEYNKLIKLSFLRYIIN